MAVSADPVDTSAVVSKPPAACGIPRPAPIEWLCLAGGLFLTIQYAWLLDDAFVYFRYVDKFLFRGFGLVYNNGEYVEGYSARSCGTTASLGT